MENQITLTVRKNQQEEIRTTAIADIAPVGRDEFAAAGQRGIKASFMAEVWGFEYDGQSGIELDGKKYSIYRTYGPKENEKVELYATERTGKI